MDLPISPTNAESTDHLHILCKSDRPTSIYPSKIGKGRYATTITFTITTSYHATYDNGTSGTNGDYYS